MKVQTTCCEVKMTMQEERTIDNLALAVRVGILTGQEALEVIIKIYNNVFDRLIK